MTFCIDKIASFFSKIVSECALFYNFYFFLDSGANFCYNKNMLYYNKPLFQELLKHLALLTHTGISFYDENFLSTNIVSRTKNYFCATIKENWRDKCLQSDTVALQTLLSTQDSCYYYRCHLGLIEMAFKLESQNKLLGYILVGPFRSEEEDVKNRTDINRYCATYSLNNKKVLQYFHKLPKFTMEKYEAIRILIFSMLDYATARNILSIKDDYFHSLIAPYIQEHLEDDLSVESLCSAFYISKKKLYTIFNNSVGLSPQRYVTSQRIQEAKNLLLTTDLPLSLIASKVGFSDYNYFIKVFKLFDEGRTPKYYRKNK